MNVRMTYFLNKKAQSTNKDKIVNSLAHHMRHIPHIRFLPTRTYSLPILISQLLLSIVGSGEEKHNLWQQQFLIHWRMDISQVVVLLPGRPWRMTSNTFCQTDVEQFGKELDQQPKENMMILLMMICHRVLQTVNGCLIILIILSLILLIR